MTSVTITGTRNPSEATIVVVFTLLLKLRITSGLDAIIERRSKRGLLIRVRAFRNPLVERMTTPKQRKVTFGCRLKNDGWSGSSANSVTSSPRAAQAFAKREICLSAPPIFIVEVMSVKRMLGQSPKDVGKLRSPSVGRVCTLQLER